MKPINYILINTILSIVLLSSIPVTIYADDDDHERAKQLMETGDILPLENILNNARDVYSGKIIEVELESENGQLIYELEILDKNGKVWELQFDAYTGKLLDNDNDNEKEH